jgi:L-amino acid N-acyltransferase YncA
MPQRLRQSDTAISFETDPPSAVEMAQRIAASPKNLPWIVSVDNENSVEGYAYASRHRQRAAYQWSVDVSVYVRVDRRHQNVGSTLYRQLLGELTHLGYFQAFAGIALPNAASVGLHARLGFMFVGVYKDVGYKLGAWQDAGWWQLALQSPSASNLPPTNRAGEAQP